MTLSFPADRLKRKLSQTLFLAALAGGAGLATGCQGPKCVVALEPRFSVNVARVPPCFPPENEPLTPAQQDVMNRRGRPEFIRFWWNREGGINTSSDFSGKQADVPEMLKETKATWIYLHDQVEVEFRPDGTIFENPVDEKINLLCRYGDPNIRIPPRRTDTGHMRESWTWTDHGIAVDLLDGVVVKKSEFRGTGAGTILTK